MLYGNALSKEDVLIKKLEPLCFLRSRFLSSLTSDSDWRRIRCMRCKPCIITSIQAGLDFVLKQYSPYAKKDIYMIYDLIYQLIRQHKINLIDLYTEQYLLMGCYIYYGSTKRRVINFDPCDQVDIYNIMRIFDLLIHNHSEVSAREIGLEPNSRELYLTLTEILQNSLKLNNRRYPELSNIISTYIASKLKYPLRRSISDYTFRIIRGCDYLMCGKVTTKYLLYHFKR